MLGVASIDGIEVVDCAINHEPALYSGGVPSIVEGVKGYTPIYYYYSEAPSQLAPSLIPSYVPSPEVCDEYLKCKYKFYGGKFLAKFFGVQINSQEAEDEIVSVVKLVLWEHFSEKSECSLAEKILICDDFIVKINFKLMDDKGMGLARAIVDDFMGKIKNSGLAVVNFRIFAQDSMRLRAEKLS